MTAAYFTPANQNDPFVYVCGDCAGHGGDSDGGPWVHPQSPDADWRDCATCLGTGEVDYRDLPTDTLESWAWWDEAPDDHARVVAILALHARGEIDPAVYADATTYADVHAVLASAVAA